MRKNAIVAVTLLVLALGALTGCDSIIKAGVEKATGVKVEGNQVTVQKDGETVAVGGEKGQLPEGFPSDFPMFEPLEVTAGMKAEANGVTQYTVTANTTASFNEIQTFYADELKAAGWEVKVEGTTTNGAGAGSVNATKGEDKAAVQMVQTGPDSKVEVVFSLQMK